MDGTDELSVSSSNILTPGGSVAATIRTGSYHTYLKDIQGSTGSIVKEDGSLSAAYKYSDFGETKEITGSSFDNEICYTGQVYDDETGLYYYNARYYDPANGRFISQDTYRGETDEPGTWHLYAYCANDPINYVDPSGHKYKWNKTVWLKGPKTDYFYRKGHIKGKTGSAKKIKMRVGTGSNNRYEIKYHKLVPKRKTRCDEYKESLDLCNDHYDWMVSDLICAAVNMTVYWWLSSKEGEEIADIYLDSYNTYLQLAGEKYYDWKSEFANLKTIFKDVKKYGKKLN